MFGHVQTGNACDPPEDPRWGPQAYSSAHAGLQSSFFEVNHWDWGHISGGSQWTSHSQYGCDHEVSTNVSYHEV